MTKSAGQLIFPTSLPTDEGRSVLQPSAATTRAGTKTLPAPNPRIDDPSTGLARYRSRAMVVTMVQTYGGLQPRRTGLSTISVFAPWVLHIFSNQSDTGAEMAMEISGP